MYRFPVDGLTIHSTLGFALSQVLDQEAPEGGEYVDDFARGMLAALTAGTLSLPHALLRDYKQAGLQDGDVMLLIHLLAFRDNEHNEFPAMEELEQRMSCSQDELVASMQRLMKQGWMSIEEAVEAGTDIQGERYNLHPVWGKLAAFAAAAEQTQQAILAAQTAQVEAAAAINREAGSWNEQIGRLFAEFQEEFARPLSPMECETISAWVDQDKYSEELIRAALREAVFAGKLHFRYIDRILLEWSRHQVSNAEEAMQFARKFRGGRQGNF